MTSLMHSSPNNKILNDYDYSSIQPFTIRSQIVKVVVDSNSLCDKILEHTNDIQCRRDDWSTNLKEANDWNVRSPRMKDSHAINKQRYEMIEECTKRNRNQNHILEIKEHNRSFDINSGLRIKNGRNRFMDSRININFDKYEKRVRNRKEITPIESETRFIDNDRNIHNKMHYIHNKDLHNKEMVDPDCYGSIYDHMNQNRARNQFRSRYAVNTSELRLCQDNNKDKAAIDSRNIKLHDDDERGNIIQDMERGKWLAHNRVSPPTPTLYSIQKAIVHSIRPFGIFVQIEGYQDHGLVHISEVSNNQISTREDSEEANVKALWAVAREGEPVWVRVISVKVDADLKTRIGCSMKHVNQGDGRALDPNGDHLEQPWREGAQTLQSPRRGSGGLVPGALHPRQLLATGSVGRGRAMVQPAWMKHGLGIGGPVAAASPVVEDESQSSVALTMEEGSAVIARLKEEKRRRKEERKRRRERRHGRPRRGERKERHKKRRHGEERHRHHKRHRF